MDIAQEMDDFMEKWRKELAAKETTKPVYLLTPTIRETKFETHLPTLKKEQQPYVPPIPPCCFSAWLNHTTPTLVVVLSSFSSKGCYPFPDPPGSVNSTISDINGSYLFNLSDADLANCSFDFGAVIIGTYERTVYADSSDCTGVGVLQTGNIRMNALNNLVPGEVTVQIFTDGDYLGDATTFIFNCKTQTFLSTSSVPEPPQTWNVGSATIDGA